MPKAKFILKEPNAKSETLIYLIYNYQYNRFKYSTGEKINPKYWGKNTQRAKETKKFPEFPEFNARLDIIESGINTAFRKLLNDGIQPDNKTLKKALEEEISDHILKPPKTSFFEFIENFIEESKLTKKERTVKVYNTTVKYLEQFSNDYQKLDFNSITIEFYNKFISFLSKDKKLADNTVGKHIKTLKTFMNEATERGVNDNLDFRKRKFKTIREEADTVYLSIEELKKIEALNLSESKKLDRVRDLFLIGAYTGLRFADFIQIKPENINSDNSIIKVRTQKTKDRVSIPLHKTVRGILNKYNNHLPKAFSNQKMNEYIKEICKKAEIEEITQTTITRAGILEKNTLPKYNLVSTHTARRSFATNLYLADVPSISIMKITGHTTEKSFLKYIRVTQEENANKLLSHPFFK